MYILPMVVNYVILSIGPWSWNSTQERWAIFK